MLSFSLVPSWSVTDKIMRFQLTANFEGRADEKPAEPKRRTSWSERMQSRRASGPLVAASEKRFFCFGDVLLWQNIHSNTLTGDAVCVGTVESTSVYAEQDADDLGTYVVFVKISPEFKLLQQLEDAANSINDSEKPVLFDSKCVTCRSQVLEAPASHAYISSFKIRLGPWEIVRQINACFQLLLMSLFPAIDTISDLVYILSSVFANYYIFGASIFCITAQFWLYVNRMKRRRVFEALKKRRIDLHFVKGLSFWPKWASPDNLAVFLLMIIPFYFIYFVVFPIVWFLLGYAIYSFQLFPISRISNRWLYAFVYGFRLLLFLHHNFTHKSGTRSLRSQTRTASALIPATPSYCRWCRKAKSKRPFSSPSRNLQFSS
jgi:hypothetical protein